MVIPRTSIDPTDLTAYGVKTIRSRGDHSEAALAFFFSDQVYELVE